MFGFLGFILVIILVIILFAFAVLGNLIRFVFGLGKRTPKRNNQSSAQTDYGQTATQESYTTSSSNKKKIFSEDEGEYLEFEEVN